MKNGSSPEQQMNLADLRAQSLLVISLSLAAITYLWMVILVARMHVRTPLIVWSGAISLGLVAPLSYAMRVRWGSYATIFLIMVTFFTVCCVTIGYQSPHYQYLFIPIVVLTSVLVGQRALLIITAGSLAIVAAVSPQWGDDSMISFETWFPSLVIVLTSVASWLSARSLNMALTWVWAGYERALRNEHLMRERQAELRRALRALEEATDRLQRANQELLFARRQAEEAQIIQDQFVTNVSHELRTPLNLLIGFAEMMYLAPESYPGVRWSAELQSDIGEMYRAGRHLQSLVNDILDLSRIDSGHLPRLREMWDIRPIITDVLDTIAPLLRQRGLTCHVEWPDGIPPLFIDHVRIRQVLLNLLNNGIRFTDAGGVTIRVELAGHDVVVGVHDTGIGIPEEQLGRVFEKFRQVEGSPWHRGGTGLGLALSRQFVELHGGRMWVESKVGRGSSFYFSIPVEEGQPQTPRLLHTADQRRADLSDAPIVVVDPDPAMGQMLSRYLDDRRIIPVSSTSAVDDVVERDHPFAVLINVAPDAPPESWLGLPSGAVGRYKVPVFHCAIPSAAWLQSSTDITCLLTKPVLRDALEQAVLKLATQPVKALIVDDNPGFVSLLSRMLRTGGLAQEVLTAYSGAEAVRLAFEHVPDLILLDLALPDMNGFDVVKRVRCQPELRSASIIAVTATSYVEEVFERQGEYLTLAQPGGLGAGALAELLRSALRIVAPAYSEGDNTASSD